MSLKQRLEECRYQYGVWLRIAQSDRLRFGQAHSAMATAANWRQYYVSLKLEASRI